MCEGDLPQTSQ